MPRSMMARTGSVALACLWLCASGSRPIFAADQALKASKGCGEIPSRIVKELQVPRLYHEGLYYDGKSLWLSNGEGGKTWAVDTDSGAVLDEITPVAGFTEAITARGDGTFFTTEWDEKKVYRARLDGKKLVPEASVSVAPAHPAGAIWNGAKLYVITWNRGILGTRFAMLEMDGEMNILKTVQIWNPQEPDHLAWDGRYLWMSSWYDQKVYKIDVGTWEIMGYVCSPVRKTTGIAWDGTHLWLTGTYGNLYKIEVGQGYGDR